MILLPPSCQPTPDLSLQPHQLLLGPQLFSRNLFDGILFIFSMFPRKVMYLNKNGPLVMGTLNSYLSSPPVFHGSLPSS